MTQAAANKAPTRHWFWRLAGVGLLLICVVVYEPSSGSGWQRVLLPLVMGVAAALVVQSTLAAAAAGALLAGIHSHWHNLLQGSWVETIAFPSIALICTLICLAILWRRFRVQITATRDARQQARTTRLQPPTDSQQP